MIILEKLNKSELSSIKKIINKEISNLNKDIKKDIKDEIKKIYSDIDKHYNNNKPNEDLQNLIEKICIEILQKSHEMFYYDKKLLSRRIKKYIK